MISNKKRDEIEDAIIDVLDGLKHSECLGILERVKYFINQAATDDNKMEK